MQLPLSLASAALILLAVPTGDYQYAPEQGSKIRRTYASTMELELVDSSVEVLVNGEEQDAQQPEFEVSVHQESTLVVLDQFEKVGDGQIMALTRTFESLAHGEVIQISVDGEEQEDRETQDESALEGRTVRFQYDQDEGIWKASWADDEEGDEGLLEGLQALSGYAFLLPGNDSCEVGDDWELSGDGAIEALALLLDPLGELSMFSEIEDPEEELETSELFREGLEVEEFECELKSLEDGQALIQFKVEGATAFERDSELPEELQAMGMEVVVGFELEVALEGQLTWDLAAHHMVSMEYSAELEIISSKTQKSTGEMEFEATLTQTFEGELAIEVTLE